MESIFMKIRESDLSSFMRETLDVNGYKKSDITNLRTNPFYYDSAKAESPIEQILGGHIDLHLGYRTFILQQQTIDNKRPDFVLGNGQYNIIVECDGKEFHNSDMDLKRDLEILKHNSDIKKIYRLPGTLIYNYPRLILSILAIENPPLFRLDCGSYYKLMTMDMLNRYAKIYSIETDYPSSNNQDYQTVLITVTEIPKTKVEEANALSDDLKVDFCCDCYGDDNCNCFDNVLQRRLKREGLLVKKDYHYRKLIS